MLLNEFGSLENILASAKDIRKTSIKESIIVNSEKLRTNFKLIKLDDSAPLPFTMNEIEYVFTEITTKEVLKGIGLIKH